MPDLTPERLAEIRGRADAATPGPWHHNSYSRVGVPVAKGHPLDVAEDDEPGWASIAWVSHPGRGDEIFEPEARANREFITHSRQDVPDLLAEVDRLKKALVRLGSSMPMTQPGPDIETEVRARILFARAAVETADA